MCVPMRFRRRGGVVHADNVSMLTRTWPRVALFCEAIDECSFGYIIPLPTMVETVNQRRCHLITTTWFSVSNILSAYHADCQNIIIIADDDAARLCPSGSHPSVIV